MIRLPLRPNISASFLPPFRISLPLTTSQRVHRIHTRSLKNLPLKERMFLVEHHTVSDSAEFVKHFSSKRMIPRYTELSFSSLERIVAERPFPFIVSTLVVLGSCLVWRYYAEIRRRLTIVKDESWIFGVGLEMERVKTGEKAGFSSEDLSLMELNSTFRYEAEKQGWRMITLGEYFMSLRPKDFNMEDIPTETGRELVKREIEAGLVAGLLNVLGPKMGQIFLPALGAGFVERNIQNVSSQAVARWLAYKTPQTNDKDQGKIPVALMTLLSMASVHADLISNFSPSSRPLDGTTTESGKTAIDKFIHGEESDDDLFDSIKTPFVIDKDFDRMITSVEERLRVQKDLETVEMKENGDAEKEESQYWYDPDDDTWTPPVPVNPRLFPDLYIGYGSASSTHTKREILKMRLLSILLNKLGSNYYQQVNFPEKELFNVQLYPGADVITTPDGFVEALIDSGHTVEVAVSSHPTTFGIGLCVKEDESTWSHVPLGVFVDSGYEDESGRKAPAMMPHSGVDMNVSGPIAGQRKNGAKSKLSIQHYIGIEGFTGWKPNHLPVIPFHDGVINGRTVTGSKAVQAARLCGLQATALNGVATELKLPYGGYGLTAVCNDSAAVIQHCLFGKCTIFPMTSIGPYLQRTYRYTQRLGNDLNKLGANQDVLDDMEALIDALRNLPSDINPTPASAADAASRIVHTLPDNMAFELMNDSRDAMRSIMTEETARLIAPYSSR